MAVTPQTNTTLQDMAEALLACDDFVICGHVSPDGDCLGSQLALACALWQKGKRVTCLLVKDEPVDYSLRFLPGICDMVPAACYEGCARTFVGVDVPTRDRLGEAACAVLDSCEQTFTIDHHAVDSTMAHLVYVDPDAASTTTLVWRLAQHLGADRRGDIALCCYTGLVTDTGRFQYQNTDVEAFRCAMEMLECGVDPAYVSREIYQNRTLASMRLEGIALERMRLIDNGAIALSWLTREDFEREGAVKADAEPLIDALRAISGVRVACMLREQEDGIRGSLRAKDATDVSQVARKLGGGGHKAAAGFTVHAPLGEAVSQVETLLERAVSCA